MTEHPTYTTGADPYPRPPYEGLPERRRPSGMTAVLLAFGGAILVCLVAAAGWFALLYVVNPVGDEWICSDGEAPAGGDGYYNACYDLDQPLPEGISWDPFGNRPMSYNCDKDGWHRIERTVQVDGADEREQNCVREDTELTGGWRVAKAE